MCDDGFSSFSAEAICRELGFTSSPKYRYSSASTLSDIVGGISYPSMWRVQEDYPILMDEVVCDSGQWANCSYVTHKHDCSHLEDISLHCGG